MRRPGNRLWILAAAAMLLGLLGALWAMLHSLVAGGAGYDYYSSYRTDPWGLSVFHDSLAALPELEVTRNLRSIEFAQRGYERTVLFAGATHTPDPESLIDAIETFVISGGRLVIAFRWLGVNQEDYEDARESWADAQEDEDEDSAGDESTRARMYTDDLDWIDDRWGFRYRVAEDGDQYPDEPLEAKRTTADSSLPEMVFWSSTDYFEPKIPEWKTLYEVDGRAAVMERSWGDGSIAIASDTYFLCNEAMVHDRHPELLAWVVGDSTHLMIDETIHYVRQETGLMGLIRQYGLTGLLFAFAVVALLHVWRQANPLVPQHTRTRETEVAHQQTLRDAHAGLVRLLARSVPPARLMSVVVAQWRRTLQHDSRIDTERIARVEALAQRDPKSATPQETYRDIVHLLKERR